MPPLKDKLDEIPRRATGTPCSVGALEEYLDGAEADAFYAMLHTLGWSGQRVYDTVQGEARELRDKGDLEAAAVYAAMSMQQVNRHRSRSCRCFRSPELAHESSHDARGYDRKPGPRKAKS